MSSLLGGKGSSKHERPWWLHFFDSPESLFLGRFPDPATSRWEAESLARLVALTPDRTVADIPCGPGRHLVYWAEMGCRAVGLDASPMMLDLAARACRARGVRADLVLGLMQALPFRDEVFDVVFNLFNSFGYLETEEENQRVLAEAARCLKPGGLFVLDTRNPPMEILFAPYREDLLLPDGREMRVSANYDLETRRLRVEFREMDGELAFHISVRLYNLAELTGMMGASGLQMEAAYSDVTGTPFDSGQSQLLIVARRA